MLESTITARVLSPESTLGAPIAAGIAGLGVATPARTVTASMLADRLGVSREWIVKRTGTDRRPVCSAEDSVEELARLAGVRALADAQLDASEIDLLLFATTTRTKLLPDAAPAIATALGCTNAGAIDLGGACTGFLTGLALAMGQIESTRAQAVLVIGADAWTRFVDPQDARVVPLWGDGGGAAVLTASEGSCPPMPVLLRCDGRLTSLIQMDRGALLSMRGSETFDHATRHLADVSLQAIAAAGLQVGEVDLFVFHQANARITRAVARSLGVEMDRVVDCIDQTGNTGAASLPLALDHARREGRLHDGARLLLGAVGAGMCWGATVVEWGSGR